jgi:hypothetical protein
LWLSLAQKLLFAQDIAPPKKRGQLFFSWGYNRDWYSNSTIHFVKTDADPAKSYDFTLYDATAHDKPDYDDYWNLARLTVPQYDFRVGYQFNDKHDLGLEVDWDHLKYVVTDWQNVRLKGQIHGTSIDRVAPLDPDTVHLQHTNGNNYLLFSLTKRKTLYSHPYFQVDALGKVGAGPLISYTISTILGDYDPGYFHYHGWVVATSLGVRVSFLKNFFIQSDFQGAFVDYTNTKLGKNHDGLSTHTFYSLQWSWEGGVIFPIGKK